jgi:hypothetical protein
MFALLILSCKLERCCDNGRCGVLDTLVAFRKCLACCLKKLRAFVSVLTPLSEGRTYLELRVVVLAVNQVHYPG